MLSIILSTALMATPVNQVCKCGIACECADIAPVAVITHRVSPAKVCVVTERPKAKPAVVAKTATTRAPVGHTHTCANGHTWDHSANPTHTCRICGLSQYVQDARSRPVTVIATQAIRPQPVAYQPPPVMQPLYQSLYSPTSGGCANGQCSTIQSRGFFRR